MAKERYYWLMMRKDLFFRPDFCRLELEEDGHELQLLFIKLMLASVDGAGELKLNPDGDNNSIVLSAMTRTPVTAVEKALEVYKRLGMIREKNGVLELPLVKELLGL